jgi:hypothetical protein
MRYATGLLALAFAVCPQAARAQSDKVFRTLTTDKLETLLKDAGIDFKKTAAKNEGVFFYDYKKNNYDVRLHYYHGKDLMLDAIFAALPLEKVNLWNRGAKFSRVVLDKDSKGDFSVIEWNLNFAGGVTDDTVREFMNSFDEELKKYAQFVAGEPGAKDEPKVEKIFNQVAGDVLEKILDDLNLKYNKTALPKDAGFGYEYDSKGMKMILTNYGKDIMLQAHFKKIPLDKVNKYNLDRKFIRAVAYKNPRGEHTSLESNLDCVGGVSESILRHFITVFEGEVRDFTKYVEKITTD